MNVRQANFRLQLICGVLVFVVVDFFLTLYLRDLLGNYNLGFLAGPEGYPAGHMISPFTMLLGIPFALFLLWIWEKQGFLKRKSPEEAQQPDRGFQNWIDTSPLNPTPGLEGARLEQFPVSGTGSKWDVLVILACMGMLALFCGYALYIILVLPAKYDHLLPFTGTFLDRIVVGFAIVALVVIFFLVWKRDTTSRSRWNNPEEVEQRGREWSRVCYSWMGQSPEQGGPRAERVAKINRTLNYLTAFSGIILIVLVTGGNFLQAAFRNNPEYLVATIFAPVVLLFIYDFWYSDEIRVLEDVYPNPSARLWLRVSRRGAMATPLTTAGIVVFFILAVCSVVCFVVLPVSMIFDRIMISLVPATACIVCLLARVK
jgi:hypothetical protein